MIDERLGRHTFPTEGDTQVAFLKAPQNNPPIFTNPYTTNQQERLSDFHLGQDRNFKRFEKLQDKNGDLF